MKWANWRLGRRIHVVRFTHPTESQNGRFIVIHRSQRRGLLFVAIFSALIGSVPEAVADETARDWGRAVLEGAGVGGGLIVHVPCGEGRMTVGLRGDDRCLVQGLDVDAGVVERARGHVRSLGVYGDVSIDTFDGERLPYVDNLVNLLVCEDLGRVPMGEVIRVLVPGGVAYLKSADGWQKTVKPWPDDIDEWTHWLHGADGNAVAEDRVVGPPRHAQWIAEPTWQRHHELSPSLDAMVTAQGRLFAIINEAPIGVDGLPDRWVLVARDAFNGTLLWKRPIAEWGWRHWSDHSHGNGRWNHPTQIARRLVADGDRVYVTLGFNAPLVALDAATGRTVTTYPETEFTDEILYHDGTLVLTVNLGKQEPGSAKEKPPVKKAVMALNALSGEVLWKTGDFEGAASKADAIERVTHLMMVLGGGKVFLVEENAVVALDLKSGRRLWRKDRPPRQKPVTYGNYYFANLSTLVYHDGVVFFTEPDCTVTRLPWDVPARAALMGISADSGEVLWTRQCGIWGHYNPADLFVIDGLAWVHDAEAFSMIGLDPRSGEIKRTLSTKEALEQGHHHRCYRNKATTRYVLTGRRGVEFIDVKSEENQRHHWVRGTCRYGIMPANGLLYAPPHPCVCYITAKLTGFWALAPESGKLKAESGQAAAETARFERGPAYGQSNRLSALSSPLSEDWPTYRHDAARSGSAGTKIEGVLDATWETKIGGRLSSPVIAGGKVFVASSDSHTVWALDAAGGKPLWSFSAGARVDTPPTVHQGLALFGSADGWVYCLRAADGKLAWRRRAAPDDVRMINRGQLESPWPVHGSVLIQDGVAYLAAGRSSFLDGGILVYALHPATGDVLLEKRINSLDPETHDMLEARLPYDMPPDATGALPDVFVGDGANVYMRHLKFNPADLTYRNAALDVPKPKGKKPRVHPAVGSHLMSVAGLLDDAWFNQTYWTVDGKSQSKLLVFDDRTACGVKPCPGNARHSRAVFTAGKKGYTLFASRRPEHKPQWTEQIPVRVRAMVLAGDTLILAGTPDQVPKDDPYAAFDGRIGATLWTVSVGDGKKLAEHKLDSPPVFDGMAAANGRVYLSTTDGTLRCLGGD